MKYNHLIKDMSSKFNLRIEMVKFAMENGVSEAAREFKTTRKTVRKWRDRYRREGAKGLLDRSRAPQHIPHKMPEKMERRIEELRERHKRKWGPHRLKMHYGLEVSENAIGRVIRQKGLLRKRRRKWQRRQELREAKARMRVFEKIQVDTKDLKDIPEYYPQMRIHGLPRFQYTARDMATGAAFFAFAEENNSTYAGIFARLVIEHLKSYGIEVKEMEVQTDNGSEYIGSVRRKYGMSEFEKVLSEAEARHTRIPPGHCTWQSDVERFHGLIEEEFYMCETFESEEDFLAKAYAYQLFFNYERRNRARDDTTPLEIFREKLPEANEQVLNLLPIRLELVLSSVPIGGYHVPASVSFPRKFCLTKNYIYCIYMLAFQSLRRKKGKLELKIYLSA
ncbi:MAG: hypothetical protein D6732_29430 [Methanobacteriota archaeon]|nr:MAG: hypothetical protein D6732_29430 [Euryarchaeota archaeon]